MDKVTDKEFRYCKSHGVKCWKRPWGKWSHKLGEGWCNKDFDDTTMNDGVAKQQETREPISEDKPDWDAIACGKIRSLFLQAHIQKNGLVGLTVEEDAILDALVERAMGDSRK